MKILIDMNLSPAWVPIFKQAGWDAMHWSEIGAGNAPDRIILEYARDHQLVLFTHDLDFGTILAASQADCPSVIQLRIQDLDPQHSAAIVINALVSFQERLESGALITIDTSKMRARILPIR